MNTHVPFIDLGPWIDRVAPNTSQAFEIDVENILDTREFLGGGPTTQKLEAALATKLGASHVVTCANGTDALQLALRACGIDRGHRVAMPAVTFWATYEAILNVGATPVLLDIDPADQQLSFTEFEHAYGEHRFDAAILVHLYGWCSARLADFRSFCRDRRITLIEDGAQAFGVRVQTSDGVQTGDESIFADADVATLSFHPAKVLGGIGDGGAVVTKNRRTAQRVRALANHGRAEGKQHEHVAVGWNSRLDAIQAAWLLRALDVVDDVIEERIRLHDIYANRMILEAPNEAPMMLPFLHNGYMTLHKVPDPARVVARLAEAGVEARRIYPKTIADQDAGGSIQYGDLKHARVLVEHCVSLPLWYGMTDEQVERCAKAFVEAVR